MFHIRARKGGVAHLQDALENRASRQLLGGTQAFRALVSSTKVTLEEQLASSAGGRLRLHSDLSAHTRKQ
jgi:hypothetical protein